MGLSIEGVDLWVTRMNHLGCCKELKLSYYIGETLLFTIYNHYVNLKFLNSNPVIWTRALGFRAKDA